MQTTQTPKNNNNKETHENETQTSNKRADKTNNINKTQTRTKHPQTQAIEQP